MTDYMGVLGEVCEGLWADSYLKPPFAKLLIDEDLSGSEAELISEIHNNQKVCVVADAVTWELLGERINNALGIAACEPQILQRPKPDMQTVEQVSNATDAQVLIGVGSGSITDIVKHASYISKRKFSVFATSPMNAYTTASASITIDGAKKSLPSHVATGVFFELKTAASCPPRLLANALADVVCRSSAQVDWMLAQEFTNSKYSNVPYQLLARDENELMENASKLLTGDYQIIAGLIRTCVSNGIGSLVMNSTHCGSMAEHSISHYLDGHAGKNHPGSLHGEQVGVATLTVMRLQEQILNSDQPPTLHPTADFSTKLIERYGEQIGTQYAQATAEKAISAQAAADWNKHWQSNWNQFAEKYRKVMIPATKVQNALSDCKAAIRASELGFKADFYRQTVLNARHLRNRFSILDIAGDSGLLENYVANMEV